MSDFPKVGKSQLRLSQDDGLRNTTIQLLTSALLSAGLFLSGNTPVEAKSVSGPTFSAPSSKGSAINLAPGSAATMQGNALLAGHHSHRSHASHASHHSHYSSR